MDINTEICKSAPPNCDLWQYRSFYEAGWYCFPPSIPSFAQVLLVNVARQMKVNLAREHHLQDYWERHAYNMPLSFLIRAA